MQNRCTQRMIINSQGSLKGAALESRDFFSKDVVFTKIGMLP